MSTFVTPRAASQLCKSSTRGEEGTYVAPKSIPTKNLPMLAASGMKWLALEGWCAEGERWDWGMLKKREDEL